MKIEIWSDIMCPFCYIGKRHLEKALESFSGREAVEIEWKSYQLDPTIPMTFEEPMGVYAYLADRKGWSMEQSEQMHEHVVEMAASVGLEYNFDRAVVANSMFAHRVIQFAKEKGLGDAIEEIFFSAYFTEGRDLASVEELVSLGEQVGLEAQDVRVAIASEEMAYRVSQDIQEGVNLGVRGVPFFVFDRKYGISGAEPIQVFIDTLNQTKADAS
ncbi:MAG: DsbA family oxidoreductase [Bacteroidota bacterium]